MAIRPSFGHVKTVSHRSGEQKATLVPLDLLNHIRLAPVPFTTSGSSNITVTVNASVTNPVYLWAGSEYLPLRSNLAYTWANSATNAAISAAGATSSANTPGATGVKYYYIGAASDGTIQILPSTAKPSYVEGPFPAGVLGHPGTSRTRFWRYVGWNFMNATTPAFDFFLKSGFVYNMSVHAHVGVDTQPGEITMAAVPKHAGVLLNGYVTAPATAQVVELGAGTDPVVTNALIGTWRTYVAGASVAAEGQTVANFADIPVSTNGIFYNVGAPATGAVVNITRVEDVV